MRKTLLAAAAALLFLLPSASSLASPLGVVDLPENEEYRFRWGEGFATRYQNFISSPRPDRSAWQNQAYLFCEYAGFDWSVAFRGGATSFTFGGDSMWDPVPYLGGAVKAVVWAPPGSAWSVGATASYDQAFPFETGGSRPQWISGLYNAAVGLEVQRRRDERRIFYGGPVLALAGFSAEPRYRVTPDNASLPAFTPGGAYYKLKDHVGIHGGVAWTLPGIDLQAEGQLTKGAVSAGVTFRLPLEGGPASVFPRSIREIFRGWGDRPKEEKDGRFRGPIRDDGPEEIPPAEGEGK